MVRQMSTTQLLRGGREIDQASSVGRRIRILVAKPGLDGHDRGALVLSRAFRDAGMEVVYSGLLPTPEQVAQMAIDEDVDIIALSLLNGAHMTAFPKVVHFLKEKGGVEILVVGGGIIPETDKPKLEKMGILGNFGPGTSLKTIVEFIKDSVAKNRAKLAKAEKKRNDSKKRNRATQRKSSKPKRSSRSK
jgi:methylmalonyl-CoA mutase, C-terminal domain